MKFVNLEEADDVMVQSYFNEIDLLNRLQGNDNIIKLFDWWVSKSSQEQKRDEFGNEVGVYSRSSFLV